MSREARKGDLALVVGSINRPDLNGSVVSVLSDPIDACAGAVLGERIHRGKLATCALTGAYRVNEYAVGNNHWWMATERLIPLLNPDPEQATERERERTT